MPSSADSRPRKSPSEDPEPTEGSSRERAIVALLTSVPQELAFGGEEPAAIVDRYYTPDFEQYNNGTLVNRERLVQHAQSARKNVTSLRTDVDDVLVSGQRFAARYTMHVEMRKGVTLSNEVFMHARLAADGRIQRIDSVTRSLKPLAPEMEGRVSRS